MCQSLSVDLCHPRQVEMVRENARLPQESEAVCIRICSLVPPKSSKVRHASSRIQNRLGIHWTFLPRAPQQGRGHPSTLALTVLVRERSPTHPRPSIGEDSQIVAFLDETSVSLATVRSIWRGAVKRRNNATKPSASAHCVSSCAALRIVKLTHTSEHRYLRPLKASAYRASWKDSG